MRSYSHLSEDERDQIGVLGPRGGRSGPSPGPWSGESHCVQGTAAERSPLGRLFAGLRRRSLSVRRQRKAILEREADLRLFVGDLLAEGWTPEQISGWLKSGNEPRLRAIGCETIYAFIYRTGQKAEALWRYLTRRHKRRRPRRARASRDTIKDRASIHDRRKTIESRGEAGHWEATSSSANAHGLCSSCMSACDAYASWQKGGVENANGRLRRWLPRHRCSSTLDVGNVDHPLGIRLKHVRLGRVRRLIVRSWPFTFVEATVSLRPPNFPTVSFRRGRGGLGLGEYGPEEGVHEPPASRLVTRAAFHALFQRAASLLNLDDNPIGRFRRERGLSFRSSSIW